jgi:uncharacterized protein (DUF305 family)
MVRGDGFVLSCRLMLNHLAYIWSISELSVQRSRLRSRAGVLMAAISFALLLSIPAAAQQADPPATIVQPGAPGQPTRVLPPTTRAVLPPRSPKDVEFMQGMIMHHAQAVEMTALIEARSVNKELKLLGARISHTQAEEIGFMKRWLERRGEVVDIDMGDMSEMSMGGGSTVTLMPGMLTAKQMKALKLAKGAEFDRLFLAGMIQHHRGALQMVRELFDTAGAGQDAEIFNFATDVDSGQRAEIRIMETMLEGSK